MCNWDLIQNHQSGQSFHAFWETLKSSGLCCSTSDTAQTLRSSCLLPDLPRKTDYKEKLALLTLPPWCRSSWPACPPCSHQWHMQPGSAQRTQPGVEQKDRALLKDSRDINIWTQTQNCLQMEFAFPLLLLLFFFSVRQWEILLQLICPREAAEVFMVPHLGVQTYRIRLIAVISTEGIKNEQDEKHIQERIIIIKRGKVIWIQIPSFHLETFI